MPGQSERGAGQSAGAGEALNAAGCPLFPEALQAETALATLPVWRALGRLLARREPDALDPAIADAIAAAAEL